MEHPSRLNTSKLAFPWRFPTQLPDIIDMIHAVIRESFDRLPHSTLSRYPAAILPDKLFTLVCSETFTGTEMFPTPVLLHLCRTTIEHFPTLRARN